MASNSNSDSSAQVSNRLWEGRTSGLVSDLMDQVNRSIRFDQRLFRQDVRVGIAHATMLGRQGIITPDDARAIVDGLKEMLRDYDAGTLAIDLEAEDVHTFVEFELTRRVGVIGKKLHTGRSRNDLVTTDLRLFLADSIAELLQLLVSFVGILDQHTQTHKDVIMPGYTHLQRAQPVTFGHHMGAYASMFRRDFERLTQCRDRLLASCPLGAGALAGSSFPLDRAGVAADLGFSGVMHNTLDSVSDRDYVLEFLSDAAILMMHLSRFSEEIILWCSQEFRFITLDDTFTTGSSMMPQKKNPDLAELVRGKTGRIYGDLMAALTMMKGLPLAYNKDMQEDKETLFDAVDTLKLCLQAFAPMIETLTVHPETMRSAVSKGYLNATALANYLTAKGVPFREAYLLSGQAVRLASAEDLALEELPIEKYLALSPHFDEALYTAIAL